MNKFIGLTGVKIIKEKLIEYGVKNIIAYLSNLEKSIKVF